MSLKPALPSARGRRRPLTARLLMALLAGGLFLLGYQWGNRWQLPQDADHAAIEGVRLRPVVPLPTWALADANGQPVTATDFAGAWVLLGMAPVDDLSGHLTMARLIAVFNRLADVAPLRERLHLVVVSPRLDATQARDFQQLLTTAWVLTGSAEQRERLRALLHGPVLQTPSPAPPTLAQAEPGDLLADAAQPPMEPAALYLIDPDGALLAIFPPAQSPAAIARDLRQLAGSARDEV
jgi:hypothetical protein